MRGCGLLGVCTFSVTTSKCEFVKLFSLESVFQPFASCTSLLRLTREDYPRNTLRQRLICTETFSGEGAPMPQRKASERRTSKTFATSTSNKDENFFRSANAMALSLIRLSVASATILP